MSKEELEIFNVLNFLNNGYEIEDIFQQGQFDSFQSTEECINFLVGEGYIKAEASNSSIENDGQGKLTAEEISKKYTVLELKELLKDNGLKVSGKKQELVERILPVLNDNGNDEDLVVSSDLELTDKAHEFLNENEWMDLYMFALVAFRFEDYETYVKSSSFGSIETGLKFCDEIISRALMANHFLVFIEALSAKAHVYAYDGDYESYLDYDLQRFIFGLNPINLNSQEYATYNIIDRNNIINIRNVLSELEMGSLKKRFDKIWNKSHIKNVTVPRKTSYKLLKKAVDGADIEELNFNLKDKFFSKKFGI